MSMGTYGYTPTAFADDALPRDPRLRRAVLAQWVASELDACKRDLFYFVENYVRIEEKGDEPKLIPFELWPMQRDALKTVAERDRVIVLKARQIGMTWLVLSYAAWRMVFTPGYRVLAVSKTEDDAIELTRRMKVIFESLPPWMVRRERGAFEWKYFTGPIWRPKAERIEVFHPGGNQYEREARMSEFKVFPASGKAGRSFSASMVILDEYAFAPQAEEIWSSLHATVNQPGIGGKVVILSTMLTGTQFEREWQRAVKNLSRFVPIFLSWRADPRRSLDWYEQVKRDEPLTYMREYPNTPEEACSQGPHTFFLEFSESIHVIPPFEIPHWWRRWAANDPGYRDPYAWYCFAVDQDGIVYVYREYTRKEGEPEVTYSEQAKAFARLAQVGIDPATAEPIYEEFEFIVTGHDALEKHPETGKSISDYYEQGFSEVGFKAQLMATTPDRARRAAVIHEYLKPYMDENLGKTVAKVRIFSTCTELIKSLPQMVVDKHDPEKYGAHPMDHAVDAFGYGLQAWHPDDSSAPDTRVKSVIERDKERLMRRGVKGGIRF